MADSGHKVAAVLENLTYPEQLPVAARKDEIADAIKRNQVVIIAGETGSGKTTQIPKICLELGRGVDKIIGHTQPRRLAARTVAERIAEELKVELGGIVGSTIRFDDKTSPDTAIKLMTDGILLSEIRRDRLLNAYDTIIIDEAHERSLNIDFLLGYLRKILPARPDLKLIITSATIDPERFSQHFKNSRGEPAPIIEVSGRTFPVEVRYRPLTVEQGGRLVDIDPLEALADAVSELLSTGDGDVLVFLSGEREIKDAEEVLRGRALRNTEIFPLYARLSNAEQQRAYRAHHKRRVVLSTNIAETSVTVPGIRYVVDTGLARISRYSTRTKVQRLPIEPISQASAAQRSGRCGRVADGICIRLYSEDDFDSRAAFTDPEILRTNLASVILSMADLDLGAIESFPFVEMPDSRAIRDGIMLLTELGALATSARRKPRQESSSATQLRLTNIGHEMASLPLDPRLSRMLVQAHHNGSLADVLVIVSALTIQDVREWPAEEREKAEPYHRRFTDRKSDFLGYLNIWRYISTQRRELSGSAFRKMCKAEYLHWLRIREWQDLHTQLMRICRDHGWRAGTQPCDEDLVHQALLAGLLSHVGMRVEETREFQGARAQKFAIFPGSALAKKPPHWVMASEMVETSRLWARDAARIDPAWIEKLAEHLVTRQYSEPHFSASQGAAMTYEKVLLYGLPVVAKRRIPLARIDKPLARELLIRHGIVEGQWSSRIPVLAQNATLIADAREFETRSRRSDLVIDDEGLVAFYAQRIPTSVATGRELDSWWRKEGHREPDQLRLSESDLHLEQSIVTAASFPGAWKQGEMTFELSYSFDPGTDADGLTVRIPLPQLGSVSTAGFEWLVPGLREELYTEMLRTLPKYLRRLCAPPAEYANLLSSDLTPRSAPLSVALARALSSRIGATVDPADFHAAQLPAHLRMRFEIIDGDTVVASGTDLTTLKSELGEQVQSGLAELLLDDSDTHTAWTAETFGDIPESISRSVGGTMLKAYPALELRAGALHLVACTSAAVQRSTQTKTLLQLLSPALVSPQSILRGRPAEQRLALTQYRPGGADALVNDATIAAVGRHIAARGGPVFTVDSYEELVRTARAEIPGVVAQTIAEVLPALVQAQHVHARLEQLSEHNRLTIRATLDFLVGKSFLVRHSPAERGGLERHVKAVGLRTELALSNPARHAELTSRISPVEQEVAAAVEALRARAGGGRASRNLQWMLAEYRVSVFAQQLGTGRTVSPERIAKAIAAALAPAAQA